MGIAYRRHPAPAVSTRLLAPVALVTLVLLTVLHSSEKLEKDLALYRPTAAAPVDLSKSDWLEGGWKQLSAYRDDLKGRQFQPLDIQWSGELQAVTNRLLASGWRKPRTANLHGLLALFNSDATVGDLPVLPQVHQGASQQLLLVHDTDDEAGLLALRLWDTEYRLSDSQTPLWVGDVTWLAIEENYRLFRFLRTDSNFSGAMDLFLEHTNTSGIRQVQRSLPGTVTSGVIWDGRVLLIEGN